MLRLSYLTVEINLILWLAMLGALLANDVEGWPLWSVSAGCLFAAVCEHQAYYKRKHDRKAIQNQIATSSTP